MKKPECQCGQGWSWRKYPTDLAQRQYHLIVLKKEQLHPARAWINSLFEYSQIGLYLCPFSIFCLFARSQIIIVIIFWILIDMLIGFDATSFPS